MFGKAIVKVIGNSCGHNYIVGDFYTISGVATPGSSQRLDPLLPMVNTYGTILPGSGSSIQVTDFVRVDPFSDNEELVSFLKEKESVLLTSVLGAIERAISFKEEVKKITDFSNIEEYMTSRITACKASLSEEGISDDEQGKKILALLATIA